jgi:hypothetical protein
MLLGDEARPVREAQSLTTNYESTVQTMRDPGLVTIQ